MSKYIDGRTNKPKYCMDCGIKLSDYRPIRCKPCANKELHKRGILNSKGKSNPMSGKNQTKKTKILIGNKAKKRFKNIKKHPMFGKHHSKKSRKRISLSLGGTGISYERCNYPAKFYEIRESIRKRDNYTCQLCYKNGRDVHHIDYNKENSKINNLITLCEKCNCQVNINRDYWYAYFTYIMENNG